MRNLGLALDKTFLKGHVLPDGSTQIFELKVCRHSDPNGTRYATYPNGVSIVLTSSHFERLEASQGIKSQIPLSPMPFKLRHSLNL